MKSNIHERLRMRKALWTIFGFVFIVSSVFILVRFYPYIFAREVKGVIVSVERPAAPTALVGVGSGAENATAALFSYAVAVRESTGEIVTASTEDRQWAVAQVGKCVEAKYYPYPPWNFDKSGTYYNARLLKLYDCPEIKILPALPEQQPSELDNTNPPPAE